MSSREGNFSVFRPAAGLLHFYNDASRIVSLHYQYRYLDCLVEKYIHLQ
jgi:hypothetical protein